MPVYVDNMRLSKTVCGINALWSHMGADTLEEMHAFALILGLKPSYFQISSTGIPHYDVTEKKRRKAIKLGAIELPTQELYKKLVVLRMKREDDAEIRRWRQ